MISRPKVTILSEAKPITTLHCGACNWQQEIYSETSDKVECCSWCGWGDLEISTVKSTGGHQKINCEKHGAISISIPTDNIEPDDFMDNLFCPFCK